MIGQSPCRNMKAEEERSHGRGGSMTTMDPLVKRYVDRRREEIEAILPQLREMQDKARYEGRDHDAEEIAEYLTGSEYTFTLRQFPAYLGWVLEDVLWLAERLMTERRCRTFLERAGLHGDLTEEEETWLRYFASEALAVHRGWDISDLRWAEAGTIWPAAALVRRVLAGLYADTRTEEALEFLEYNVSFNVFSHRMKPSSPICRYPPHVEEVFFVVKKLVEKPKIIRLKETIFEREMFRGREVSEFTSYIYDNYLIKYGWTEKIYDIDIPLFWLVGKYIAIGLDVHDRAAVMNVLDEVTSLSFLDWLVDKKVKIRSQYVRAWGPSHVPPEGTGN